MANEGGIMETMFWGCRSLWSRVWIVWGTEGKNSSQGKKTNQEFLKGMVWKERKIDRKRGSFSTTPFIFKVIARVWWESNRSDMGRV